MYPVSAVLASDEVILQVKPGEHGSTYGGNPMAAAVGTAALNVLVEEKLAHNSATLGASLLASLQSLGTNRNRVSCPCRVQPGAQRGRWCFFGRAAWKPRRTATQSHRLREGVSHP
jgi:4-aminobutyrate aminotransferase-like enzyme